MAKKDLDKKLLESIIKLVPHHGWSDDIFDIISNDISEAPYKLKIFYQNGIIDLIKIYFEYLDQHMLNDINSKQYNETSITKRIEDAIMFRLSYMDKNLTKKTLSYLSNPFNYNSGLKLLWSTVDLIW